MFMVYSNSSFIPVKGCDIFFKGFTSIEGFTMRFRYVGVENGTRYDADEGKGGKQC